jgi:hypothetical protein
MRTPPVAAWQKRADAVKTSTSLDGDFPALLVCPEMIGGAALNFVNCR